ncbi:RHE_PE00001 family protein [Rhizobium sp. CSW-27]|uniref:RHE_PE00001 family protein n=1 Tax=Rhizobium sp. CSW-27 TaxID=2839985 RepID=UPI001C00A1D6|nr:RHE_PE00001 family protein [Rhizobium sp. CSW-27]MBT9372906.1 DUF1612 and helix-turn-helix domain-containing protein [Rhizobium sp. CSW-27]
MDYDLAKLPLKGLLLPLSEAAAGMARLDERVLRSRVGQGLLERLHFADACASLWVEGELVHLEDLVLHDAGHDVRAPTHELTIARDILRSRRRIAAQPVGWALSADGLASLRRSQAADAPEQKGWASSPAGGEGEGAAAPTPRQTGEAEAVDDDPLAAELATIDALLVRSAATIRDARSFGSRAEAIRDALVYDPGWNEEERLAEWLAIRTRTEGLPPVLQGLLLLDAWHSLQVLQHASWLGRLLMGEILRDAGLTASGHLLALSVGLRTVPVERRRHPDRDTRLLAMLQGVIATADIGLKEHDRLTLGLQLMERRLIGRRTSSRMADLIGLVMSRPLISTRMAASRLEITPRAALRLIEELGLREITGRGRFRAWTFA